MNEINICSTCKEKRSTCQAIWEDMEFVGDVDETYHQSVSKCKYYDTRIEPGDHIRTVDGRIGKCIRVTGNTSQLVLMKTKGHEEYVGVKYIAKVDKDIIKILEIDDRINRSTRIVMRPYDGVTIGTASHEEPRNMDVYNEEIQSVVTHEQIERERYIVEVDKI